MVVIDRYYFALLDIILGTKKKPQTNTKRNHKIPHHHRTYKMLGERLF